MDYKESISDIFSRHRKENLGNISKAVEETANELSKQRKPIISIKDMDGLEEFAKINKLIDRKFSNNPATRFGANVEIGIGSILKLALRR